MDDIRLKRTKCGYLEAVNKPTAKELKSYYASKYYQNAVGSYELSYDDVELKYIKTKIKQRSYNACELTQTSNRNMLDIGCGEGFTLKHYAKQGWQVKGVDFSEAGLQQQNPDMMNMVDIGDIYEILAEYRNAGKKYGVICLNNVLEHVLNPISLLNDLHELISVGGTLVVTVPNDCSNLQEYCFNNNIITERSWIALPDHISYFSYDSLHSIAAYTGWKCADIIADFPIDIYLLHPDSNYITHKNSGSKAHRARIQAELLFADQNIDDVINFYRAMAKVGIGRDLTAYFHVNRNNSH